MRANNSHNFASGLFIAAAVLFPFLAWGQDPFPEGRARDQIFLVCSQCHSLAPIVDSDLTAKEWELTLYDMIARGAPVHDDDLEIVRQYLIDNFAKD